MAESLVVLVPKAPLLLTEILQREDGTEVLGFERIKHLAGTGAAAGAPRVLFPFTSSAVGRESYDVAPDGKRFLISSSVSSEISDAPITVVLNW